MTRSSMFYVLLLLLVATTIWAQQVTSQGLQFSDNQLFEGDGCTIDGKSGTCLSFSACPTLSSDKLVNEGPPTCGYNGSIPIVCCPQTNQTEESSKGCVSSINNEYYPLNSSIFYKCEELICSQESWIPTKEQDPDCKLPFFAAVAKGEINQVKEFLNKGISPDTKNNKGSSIAFKAIQNGHLEILSTLLENGTNPEGPTALSHEESNLLLYAVAHESIDVIDILLSHGANINKHIYGSTPLRNAIKRKDIKIIKHLVEQKADVNEMNIYQDKTILIYGVETGNGDIVNLLIETGADVNEVAINGNTALQTAVILGNNEIAKLLLDKKANLNTRSHYTSGGTVLVEAIKRNHLDIAMTLLEYGADPNVAPNGGETALIAASQKNNTNTLIDFLLEKGADINRSDFNGKPLMLVAIESENKYMVEKLLRMGIQIDILSYREQVPLIEAVETGSIAIVKTLLDNNANVSSFDGNGNTALATASSHGFYEIVDILIHHGASVNIKTKKWPRNTALIEAASSNHSNIVTTLLENGANSNITNERGNTALMKAASRNYSDIVIKLLDNGASLNIKNDRDETAVIGPSKYGYTNVVKSLLYHGIDLTHRDNYGKTALDHAVIHGHFGVIKLLIENGADVNGVVTARVTSFSTYLQKLIHNINDLKKKQYLEIMDLLLKNGADIDAINENGETALINICSSPPYQLNSSLQEEISRFLLINNATVNLTDNIGNSALFYSALDGDLNMVKLLLEYEAPVNQANSNGKSALMFALTSNQATWDNFDLVKILLEKGADPTITSEPPYEDSTPLLLAISHQHLPTIKILLDHGSDVNENIYGYTPLGRAVSVSNVTIIEELINKGADVNEKNLYKDETILIQAVKLGNADVIKTLLKHGANINEEALDGNTAIHEAIIKNSTEIVQLLLNQNANSNTRSYFKNGGTVLHQAVKIGNIEIVSDLLDKGSDPNIVKYRDNTVLSEALSSGNMEILITLLDHGADINGGECILNEAVRNENVAALDILLSKGADVNSTYCERTALHDATFLTSSGTTPLEMTKLLVKYKTDVNIGDKYGVTPLMGLLRRCSKPNTQYPTIKYLIDNGAQTNISDDRGKTVLEYFLTNPCSYDKKSLLELIESILMGGENEQKKSLNDRTMLELVIKRCYYRSQCYSQEDVSIIISMLLEHGADANEITSNGVSPIAYAINQDQLGAVSVLLMNGVNPNQKTADGSTLLLKAVKKGNKDMVQALLSHKAPADATDAKGHSALSWAAQKGYVEIVQLLLDHGAKFADADTYGNTPLMYAAQFGHDEVVSLLLNRGANVDDSNKAGVTSLLYATLNRRNDVIQTLLSHGADATLKNRRGTSPLSLASKFGVDNPFAS